MKIPVIQGIRTGLGITAIAGTFLFAAPKAKANTFTRQKPDTFEYTQVKDTTVVDVLPSIHGTNDSLVLQKHQVRRLPFKAKRKMPQLL